MITDPVYKKLISWLKYIDVLEKKDDRIDFLHDFIIERYDKVHNEIIKKKIIKPKEINNYLFVSFRNFCIDEIKKSNKATAKINESVETNNIVLNQLSEIQIEELISDDLEKQSKLETISKIVMELPYWEKQLYYIHIIKKMPIRKIALEVGVHYTTVFKKIKQIKEKIKEEHIKINIEVERDNKLTFILKTKKKD